MNHLSRQISDLGIKFVVKAWIKKGLDLVPSKDDDGFYLMQSPINKESYCTKIFTKASDKKKSGSYIFGANQDVVDKLLKYQKDIGLKIAIIHVDVRTNTIGYSMLDNLMTPTHHDDWDFPYYESNKMLGNLIYWSSWSLKVIDSLNEDQKSDLVILRTKNKSDKAQTSIFDI